MKNKIKLPNVFLLKKPETLQKVGQFPSHFMYKKHDSLRYAIFHDIFAIVISIQEPWHFAVRVVLIYKKSDTSQKARTFAVRFYIQKTWHFLLCNFSWNYWNWRRGGGIFICKKMHLTVYILYAKNCALSVTFFYKKTVTLSYIFICKKQGNLRYFLKSKIHHILLIRSYKRAYNQIN